MNKAEYVLGVEGTKSTFINDDGITKEDYVQKLIVSKDVYDWLNMHDISYGPDRIRKFIVNNIVYVDLGFNFLNFEHE